MRKFGRPLLVLACLVCSIPAYASKIVLSGDSNIVDHLGTNAGNRAFFNNILGSGLSVGVLSTDPSSCCVKDHDTFIVNYYSGLGGGISASLLSGPITGASLAGLDLFVVLLPENAFGAGEITAISGFLGGGGTLFMLGDNAVVAGENANINAALLALGSGLKIIDDAIGSGFHTATIVPHPLTAGAAGLDYARPSRVTGGAKLLLTESGKTFAAAEGPSTVPEPATISLLAIGLAGLLYQQRRKAS